MPQLLVVFALAVPAAAQETIPATPLQKAPEPVRGAARQADALAALRTQWEALKQSATQPGADAQSIEAQREDLRSQAAALMSKDPRGELAVRTRVWAAVSNMDPRLSEALIDELLEHDLASPALADLPDGLRPGSRARARSLVTTLGEKAGDRTVRGRSVRMLAEHVKADLDLMRAVTKGDVPADRLDTMHGQERAAELRKLGVDGLQQLYEATLERVVKEYGDVLDSRGRAIGPRAEGVLFEMRNLTIGKVAPDIVAEDVDGATFKLSEYRGKVVVLDFWGHW